MDQQLISNLIIIFIPLFTMSIVFTFFDFMILKDYYDQYKKENIKKKRS